MLDYLVRALLVVREQLLETTGVRLVHEARSARAGVTLDLAVLVAEVVAAFGCVPLEALRRLAKALRRGPVGFQLGHRLKLLICCCSPGRQAPFWGTRYGRTTPGRSTTWKRYFFFGAKTMIICLPSMSGFCSTTPTAARSVETRSKS